ncbi:MAG: IPT/TIG domain-containing protein, partial [Nanoarchaeota archaeon]
MYRGNHKKIQTIAFLFLFTILIFLACGEKGNNSNSGSQQNNNISQTLTPKIISIDPTSGPYTMPVVIKGENFGSSKGTSNVMFNEYEATDYISWSDFEIKTKVPRNAPHFSVSVRIIVAEKESNAVNFDIIYGKIIKWQQFSPSGSLPSPRYDHVSIYDPSNQRMIIHGGYGGVTLGDLGDVWVLNLAGGGDGAWLSYGNGPDPATFRTEHSAVYNSNLNTMVIFGGNSKVFGVNGIIFDDTWGKPVSEDSTSPVWYQFVPID